MRIVLNPRQGRAYLVPNQVLKSKAMRAITLICLSIAGAVEAAEPAMPKFRAVEIDNKVGIGYGVAVADIDGDARPDIILVDKNVIAWYRNPDWQKHVIVESLTPRDHVCLAALDIDGDGKAELAAGGEWNPGDTQNSGAVFYLVPPGDRTQKWEPVRLHHEPTVHRMRWVKSAQNRYDLVVVPLHGRGNRGGAGAGVKILAYTRPDDPKQPWATALVDDALHMTHNFDPVEWDADAPDEMLVAAKEGVFLLARENDEWKRSQVAGDQGGGAGEVRLGRLANGNRFIATVEPMHGNALVLYRSPKSATEPLWTRKVLDDTLADGHALACGDLIGTGGDQIVVGWRAMNRPGAKVGIKLFAPLDPAGENWKETLIDNNEMACEDLCLADLNGDGRLDIVAAGRATKNLKVYFNEAAR